MAHHEYIRAIPGSTHAVVLIHGILGTPDHFSQLLPLIPNHWSVYNILLDGHGGSVRDFSHTSMRKWKAQVRTLLDDLVRRYDHIIIAAHSMGTLFAIDEAIRRPDQIKQLFLLQVPLYPRLKLKTAATSVLLPFGIIPKGAQMMQRDCSITLEPYLWRYLGWLPRFWELFRECHATRGQLPLLRVPCSAYQSRLDELVSNRSARELARHSHIHTVVLAHSGHFGYTGADLQRLKDDFRSLFP